MSGPFCVAGGGFGGRLLRIRRRPCEARTEQAHRIDEQLAEDGQRLGGEVRSAAAEPDVHGRLAAGDDRAGEGPDVELVLVPAGSLLSAGVLFRSGDPRGTLAGGGNDLLGAV